jgi:hypothetical protein
MPDPKTQGPKPEYPQPSIEPPGREDELRPAVDHGEASYRGHDRLTDCVALITGADSGIGRAVALAYAREGADVVISYLDEDGDAAQTRPWVRNSSSGSRPGGRDAKCGCVFTDYAPCSRRGTTCTAASPTSSRKRFRVDPRSRISHRLRAV